MGILKILAIFNMVFLILQFTGIPITMADELRLKNGDRLTGVVVVMEENKLVFKTAYAGEITVAWHEVSSLTSDGPITVVMGDQTSLQGTAEPAREGQMRVKSETISDSVTFDLSEVTAINPETEPAIKVTARANLGLSYADGNTNTKSTVVFVFACWAVTASRCRVLQSLPCF